MTSACMLSTFTLIFLYRFLLGFGEGIVEPLHSLSRLSSLIQTPYDTIIYIQLRGAGGGESCLIYIQLRAAGGGESCLICIQLR